VLDQVFEFWPYVAAALDIVVAVVLSAHAVLYKRDTRAAIGWVGLIWLAPIVGALLYVWLGINRIQRRARSLRGERFVPALPPGLCDARRGCWMKRSARTVHTCSCS
jgi:hypothetical protein